MKKTFRTSYLMVFLAIILSFSNVAFAAPVSSVDNSEKAAQLKLEELFKKYNGKVGFISENDPDFKKIDYSADVKSIEDLERKLDEIDQIFSAIEKSNVIRKGAVSLTQELTNKSSYLTPMSSGNRTVSTWYPVGIGAYEFAWLNTSFTYTYLYGQPPGYPGDGFHNYFPAAGPHDINIWISGIGSIICNANLKSKSFTVGGYELFTTPENPYFHYAAHDFELTVNYDFTLTYGLPTPWGTVGYTTGTKSNSETIDHP